MRSNTLEFAVRTDRLSPKAQSFQVIGFHRLVDKQSEPPAPPENDAPLQGMQSTFRTVRLN